jgi:hypothetical protein
VIAIATILGFSARSARATVPGLFDPSEEAHPGALLEVMYAHAEISYGQGKLRESVAMLDNILTTDSKHVPALELKLSALRALGDLQGVADTYQALMWIPSERERLPQYAFECAMVYRQLAKPEVARPLFEQAIQGRYQEAASHFFLGQIDLEADNPAAAQEHFLAALQFDPIDTQVKAASLYQLGTANLADNHPFFGNALIHDALTVASEAPKDAAVATIAKTASKTLEPLGRSQWFGNVNLLGEYDSNVAQLPTSNNATGVAVTELVANAGIGHVNSLLDRYQWLESVRFYGNLNFPNSTTAVYEYETLSPSIYVTHEPLSRVPWGLKLEGDYTLQGINGGGFTPGFLLSGDAGGFVKWRGIPRDELELDAGVLPQDYSSSVSGASGFSGLAEYGRVSWRREGSSRWWSPYLSAGVTNNATNDPTNSYLMISTSLMDSIRLGKSDRGGLSAGLNFYDYYSYSASSAGRSDLTLALRATASHDLNQRFSLIGDVSFTGNLSTQASLYSYVRATAGAGIAVSL